MTVTLEATPVDLAPHYGSQAEELAALYGTMLRNAGWTVEINKTHYEAHYDPDGTMWAKESVHVILTAYRLRDGHLVASWDSVLKAPKGQRCTTKRTAARRVYAYPDEGRKLSTYRKFWAAIEEMVR